MNDRESSRSRADTGQSETDNGKNARKSELAALVGIGASAGGLAALKRLFAKMPSDTGAAFVVVVHLSPDSKSHLADLLQPHSALPVMQVRETTKIEPNCVYVIPPAANLNAVDTHLRLSDLEDARSDRAPIDHFFRTLAETHDGHAIGVILSGTGSDGTLGLRWIKERGGVAIVQDPEDAEFDGMPRSAIAAGAADVIVPLEAIPQNVRQLVEAKLRVRPAAVEAVQADQERVLQKIFAQIRARTGHDFTHYKRSTILRRISRRMQLNRIEDLSAYLELIRERPEETLPLYNDLLITVTEFFRDREVFERLENQTIPALLADKGPQDRMRVWSVGCSTGEEAYSLAMLLLEATSKQEIRPQIQVFASDLHEKSVVRAREGIYPETIAAEITDERLRRFFTKENGSYRVRKEVRELVIFAPHDLLKDPPFSHVDLIVCRNVLIYLQRDAQQEVIGLFHYALNENGRLLLGTAETVDAGDLFTIEEKGVALFRRRSVPAREPRFPLFTGVPRRPRDIDANPATAAMAASYGALHAKLVEQYAPPSILIGRDHNVVHISANAGKYLHVPAGASTANVFRMLREPLAVELRSAFQAIKHSGRNVRSRAVMTAVDGEPRRVVLQVRPATNEELAGFILVIFDEQEETVGSTGEPDEPHLAATAKELEAELDLARQRLQAVVEEYETSQEEMQASNEELQSANEELRSTLEELETSKEELQSMNEELTTLNQENRHRVDELSQLSGDLQNLLAATEIATLFLDRELRIVRFTPTVGDLFNVRHTDRGRPLSDLTHRLGYDELNQDARQTLERLIRVERTVAAENGRWYLSRILPYRTVDDRIEGVVITLIDVTERRLAEEAVRRSEERLQKMLDIDAVGVLVFDADGALRNANRAFLKMSGYTQQECESGQLKWQEMTPPDWMEVSRRQIEDMNETGRIGPYEKEYLRKDGTRAWMLFVGARMEDGSIVEYCVDIEDRKKTERALRDSEERLRALNDELETRVEARTTELEERGQRLQALTIELSQAESLERTRLAHVLHDDAQQALVAAQMRLNLLDASKLDETSLNDLKDARELLRQCNQTLRTLSSDLAPPALQERGLEPAFRWLAKRMEEQHRLKVGVGVEAGADDAAENVRDLAYHVVRELLLNVVKHARAESAEVRLTREADEILVEVSDEGVGFEPARADAHSGESFGLFHARQRLRHVGGDLEISSRPGQGCRVTLRVPATAAKRVSDEVPIMPAASHGAATPKSGGAVRILLADDHQTVREGIARLLERHSGSSSSARPTAARRRSKGRGTGTRTSS